MTAEVHGHLDLLDLDYGKAGHMIGHDNRGHIWWNKSDGGRRQKQDICPSKTWSWWPVSCNQVYHQNFPLLPNNTINLLIHR